MKTAIKLLAIISLFTFAPADAVMVEKCGVNKLQCKLEADGLCYQLAMELFRGCEHAVEAFAEEMCLNDVWADRRLARGYDEVLICQKNPLTGEVIEGTCGVIKVANWICMSLWKTGLDSDNKNYSVVKATTLEATASLEGKIGPIGAELNGKGGRTITTSNGSTFAWDGSGGLMWGLCRIAFLTNWKTCVDEECADACKPKPPT